ncbi:MAG: hypothetical protein SFX19_04305 [Alphaproteobacteria bacterium]|nr:hypothetical protein [Alphaproteobacteria bacterium]
MADQGSNIYNPSDRNRDGMDDDIDRRHGNENESASYSRRYDPRSEQEFTNLPEPQDLLEARNEEEMRSMRRAEAAMHAAQEDVHYFPDVGKFIIPAENTWAGHAELVYNKELRLGFHPDRYFFDKIIADKLRLPALADSNHPDYAKYEGLRTNLAVLRNDVIGMYLDDGGFDKGDEKFIPPLKAIAETLGEALANDVWWKRPFVHSFSRDVANVEAVGAAEMYKFLLRQQEQSGLINSLRILAGAPDNHWGLRPLEQSAFSPQALSAPPPNLGVIARGAAPAPAVAMAPDAAGKRATESLALINKVNKQFQPVEALSANDKAMSVDDGRTILRWLRNLQGMDVDVQDFLSAGTPPEQIAKAEALGALVHLYASQLQHCPPMHHVQTVKDGADAAGGAAMMIAEHAMTLLPEGNPARALLASAIDTMPESYYERSTQSVARLLDHMELGLSKMSGQQIGERTAIDRLLEASERIHRHAKQLRSVTTLAEPKREESVELGREILRKLRGMMFSDKPIEEQMSAGNPDEKAALVEKIDEMVEIYRNILAEALAVNPGLANDPRIKAANDAVGGMTHGIKLMASKDIPNSIAQAQQISADVTQMPQEWKHMHERTTDRLLETMEGGLEAAVEGMEEAEQQEQRDAELAQEAIEASLLHTQGHGKRRKRRAQKSGMTGKKQAKLNRDIMADDMAAGQGRFAHQSDKDKKENASTVQPMQTMQVTAMQAPQLQAQLQAQAQAQAAGMPYMGLNNKDMAAIKSLGTALRGAGQKAKSMPVADVKVGDPIRADDKSAAERAIEQITNARKNPNNQRTT